MTWRGLDLRDYVIYELHVGTFTPEGTFDGVITQARIPEAAWHHGGRDHAGRGVSGRAQLGLRRRLALCGAGKLWRPGRVEALRRCGARAGLAVMLDVVYNHLGPEGNYLPKFGPYFTAQHKTPWGDAVNYDSEWLRARPPICCGERAVLDSRVSPRRPAAGRGADHQGRFAAAHRGRNSGARAGAGATIEPHAFA